MRFKKVSYAVLVMVLAVLMLGASCQSSRNQAESQVVSPYYGGYDGLVAEFININQVSDTKSQNAVWEDESFPISVRLRNRGEYTIQPHDVKLWIEGIAPSDFSGIDFTKTNRDQIDKVSQYVPDGGEEYIDFGNARYNNLEGTHYDATVFVKYEYPYETYINIPKVCYKENIRDQTVCQVDSVKQAFATGGPIQVGTVTQKYIGKGKIMLEIPIKNVRSGYAKAHKNDGYRPEWDEVYFSMNDLDWECKSRGNPNTARITHPGGIRGNEEVLIVCTNSNLPIGANYPKAVTLKIAYYYQDWIDATIRIKENPE